MRTLLLMGILLACGSLALGAQPVSLLVLTDDGTMDAQYRQELTTAGYQVTTTSFTNRLTPEYLRQFGAIVLSQLPGAGAQYDVGGQKYATYPANMALLHDYLAQGGGLVLEPAFSGAGEAYAGYLQRLPVTLRRAVSSAATA